MKITSGLKTIGTMLGKNQKIENMTERGNFIKMNKPKENSAEKQTPLTAEEMEDSLQQEEKKKKKKGCLLGCLGAAGIVLIIIVLLGVWGYRNRHRALPFIANRFGTKIESGIPAEYRKDSYQIELPEKKENLKISLTQKPAEEVNKNFVDYYKSEEWKVIREMEDIPSDMGTMAAFGNIRGKITMLQKEERGMVITAMGHKEGSTVLIMDIEDISEISDKQFSGN